jgi:hypothetical protein
VRRQRWSSSVGAGLELSRSRRHADRGGEPFRFKRISGHETLAMVERYAHQNGAHIQQAMAKLQARLSPSPVTPHANYTKQNGLQRTDAASR